jgi:hypothetical protein
MPTKTIVAFVTLVLLGLGSAAAQQIVSPERGTPLRVEVLNALRPTVDRETGGAVIFAVHTLNVMGAWAYVDAEPLRPDGKPIDWRRTKFREDFEHGAFSGLVLALLRRDSGSWEVDQYVMGPTDVAWLEWAEKYNLPNALFKGP